MTVPGLTPIRMGATLTDQAAQSLKCSVRDHWERETCGTRYGESADRLASFREIARTRYALEPYIPGFARFPEAAGKDVLEIGVGAGSDFFGWCQHARHATGVDLTDAGIALTTERLQLEGMAADRYTLRTADAEALPFPDASFDIVYSWGVLHHTPLTDRAYRETLRVLRPGGTMRSMIYHTPCWAGLMLYLLYGVAKGRPGLGMRAAIYQHLESPGTKAYTCQEARDLAADAGYISIETSTRLGPGDLLTIKPSDKYQSWPYKLAWALWPRPLIRLLGHRFGIYLLLEGRKPGGG